MLEQQRSGILIQIMELDDFVAGPRYQRPLRKAKLSLSKA
jgi:hypothetical protein